MNKKLLKILSPSLTILAPLTMISCNHHKKNESISFFDLKNIQVNYPNKENTSIDQIDPQLFEIKMTKPMYEILDFVHKKYSQFFHPTIVNTSIDKINMKVIIVFRIYYLSKGKIYFQEYIKTIDWK